VDTLSIGCLEQLFDDGEIFVFAALCQKRTSSANCHHRSQLKIGKGYFCPAASRIRAVIVSVDP
jgi:hypothetical protein